MKRKLCCKCKRKRKIMFFAAKGSGLQSQCRGCQQRYRRAHYLANKDKIQAQVKARKAESRAFVRKAKDVPCTDCGKRYPYWVMDFDHRDVKNFTIGTHTTNKGIVTLKKEIALCDVVCANCHRIRTQAGVV